MPIKCVRCRFHGIEANLVGHRQYCPYRKCKCENCRLIEQRQKVMAKQAALGQQKYTYDRATTSTYVPQFTEKIEQKNKCVQTVSYWSIDVSKGSLSKDLANLFDADQKHDVELKSKDQSVMAHKIVLCARSEEFKKMLKNDMQEGRTGVVEMKKFDGLFLQYFVRYLYTDELPDLTFDRAKVLYEIGSMFKVNSLMQRCSEYFKENFSVENFCQWLRFAEAHSDQKLLDAIKLYMFDKGFIAKQGFYERLSVNSNDPIIVKEIRSLVQEHVHNFSKTKAHKYVQTESPWNVNGSGGSLSRDLSNFLDTDVNHDVEIKCKDGSIMAHKIIVNARLSGFKTRPVTTSGIEIKGFDVCYVKDFVRYLYTDALPELTYESAKILCEIGRMYDVRSLIHRCLEYLEGNTPEEIPSSAAKGFPPEIPQIIIDTIIKNRAAESVVIMTDSDSDSDSDSDFYF